MLNDPPIRALRSTGLCHSGIGRRCEHQGICFTQIDCGWKRIGFARLLHPVFTSVGNDQDERANRQFFPVSPMTSECYWRMGDDHQQDRNGQCLLKSTVDEASWLRAIFITQSLARCFGVRTI